MLSTTLHARQFNDDNTNNISILEQRLSQASLAFAKAANRHEELRDHHIDTLIDHLSSLHNPESILQLKALKALKRKEKQKQVFAKLRRILKPVKSGTILQVDVPHDLAEQLNFLPKTDSTSPLESSSPELQQILQES